jgi:hypothetical protein
MVVGRRFWVQQLVQAASRVRVHGTKCAAGNIVESPPGAIHSNTTSGSIQITVTGCNQSILLRYVPV